MLKKILLFVLLVCFITLAWLNGAQAGFGISPPYVKTNKIIPGSHYEQKINLLRSSASEELEAIVEVKAEEIASWITIDKGEKFDLPKGELQVPMIVKVDVPKKAEIGNYTGYINVKVAPKEAREGGGVAIALGARIDIDLTITKETFPDFIVRLVSISDIETLGKPWSWRIFAWFFYRIKIGMKIENVGNVKIAPSKIHLDLYDISEKKLLESHDDRFLEKIEPFETKSITASFPTKLGLGQYWGKIKVYKDEEVVNSYKLAFTIAPPGTLAQSPELGVWPWLMLSALILLVLIIIFILIKIKIWRHFFKILIIISWPLRYVWRKIKAGLNILKLKFWRWIHKKSARYQSGEDKKPFLSAEDKSKTEEEKD